MHPEDAELINKDIPHFLGMYMLFGRGVYPGWRKRRNRRMGIADGRGEAVEEEQNVEEVLHAPHHPAHMALM